MAQNLVAENEMFFTQFEPKSKNRFLMYIDGIPSYLVKRISRPSATSEAKELPHINVSRYVKGKTRWNSMEATLYDPIAPSGMQAVIEWFRLGHESVTGRDGYADFYKKDIVIHELGPVGDRVGEWILKGCVLTEFNGGDLDWGSDDPVEITIRFQPDYCILNY